MENALYGCGLSGGVRGMRGLWRRAKLDDTAFYADHHQSVHMNAQASVASASDFGGSHAVSGAADEPQTTSFNPQY